MATTVAAVDYNNIINDPIGSCEFYSLSVGLHMMAHSSSISRILTSSINHYSTNSSLILNNTFLNLDQRFERLKTHFKSKNSWKGEKGLQGIKPPPPPQKPTPQQPPDPTGSRHRRSEDDEDDEDDQDYGKDKGECFCPMMKELMAGIGDSIKSEPCAKNFFDQVLVEEQNFFKNLDKNWTSLVGVFVADLTVSLNRLKTQITEIESKVYDSRFRGATGSTGLYN